MLHAKTLWPGDCEHRQKKKKKVFTRGVCQRRVLAVLSRKSRRICKIIILKTVVIGKERKSRNNRKYYKYYKRKKIINVLRKEEKTTGEKRGTERKKEKS